MNSVKGREKLLEIKEMSKELFNARKLLKSKENNEK